MSGLKLTPRRQQVREFVREFRAAHGRLPNSREIREGINTRSNSYGVIVLRKLIEAGEIRA